MNDHGQIAHLDCPLSTSLGRFDWRWRLLLTSGIIWLPSSEYFRERSKTGPRILVFGFVAKHRFHFIVGRPRTHVISRLDFGSRVYLRAQWELARSLAEARAAPAS